MHKGGGGCIFSAPLGFEKELFLGILFPSPQINAGRTLQVMPRCLMLEIPNVLPVFLLVVSIELNTKLLLFKWHPKMCLLKQASLPAY